MRGGALRASCILARSDGDIAVVDTGMPHHTASLIAALESKGITPPEVTIVFNTHAHVDHSHNNTLFPNARIYASRRDRAWTRDLHAVLAAAATPGPEHLLPFYPSMASGAYSPKVVRKILAIDKLLWDESRWREDDRTVWLEDVPPPAGISVIETPGHSPHHVSFAIQTKGRPVLVCGDGLLHRADLDGAAPLMLPWDMSAYRASHATIQAFDGIIVPGHDEPYDNVPLKK